MDSLIKTFQTLVLRLQVEGGRTMKLRLNDPAYLGHVDRFWNTLLPKMAPYLYHRGGPILMTQACRVPSSLGCFY